MVGSALFLPVHQQPIWHALRSNHGLNKLSLYPATVQNLGMLKCAYGSTQSLVAAWCASRAAATVLRLPGCKT